MLNTPSKTKEVAVRDIMRKHGLLRPRDLQTHGIAAEYLHGLVSRGEVKRLGRGLYSLPNAEITEWHGLVETAKRVPKGVICLSSALAFHHLTTQLPHEVWLLIDSRERSPKVEGPPIRTFHASRAAFTTGVEEYLIEGVTIRVTGVAKTAVDCFKYRNKIGLDVALEALRECLRDNRCTRDALHEYAKICHVEKVMRPYLEAYSGQSWDSSAGKGSYCPYRCLRTGSDKAGSVASICEKSLVSKRADLGSSGRDGSALRLLDAAASPEFGLDTGVTIKGRKKACERE